MVRHCEHAPNGYCSACEARRLELRESRSAAKGQRQLERLASTSSPAPPPRPRRRLEVVPPAWTPPDDSRLAVALDEEHKRQARRDELGESLARTTREDYGRDRERDRRTARIVFPLAAVALGLVLAGLARALDLF